MFCKRCGTQLPDDARFCPGCGLDLSGVSRPPVRQEAGPEPKSKPGPESKPGPKPKKEPKARKFTPPEFHKKPAAGKRFSPKRLIPIAAVIVCAVSLSLPFLQHDTVDCFPDPAAYFNHSVKDTKTSGETLFYGFLFEEDPTLMLESYLELLDDGSHNVYRTRQTGRETDHEHLLSSNKFVYLGSAPSWRGWTSKNALLVEDWGLDGGQHYVEVTLYNPNHFRFIPLDRYEGPGISGSSGGSEGSADLVQDFVPEETPPPDAPVLTEEPAPPAVDLSGPVAPDLESFSGGALTFQKERVYLNHTERSYGMNKNEKFIQEYLDLLEDYGFTPKETVGAGTSSVYYSFTYSGPGTVETFTPPAKQLNGPVALYIWNDRGEDIHISYGDGITYTDTGDRTSQSLTPYEGSSSGSSSIDWSSSSDSGSNVPKIRCTRCFGDREVECPECRGRGTLSNYGSTPNYSGSGRTSYSAPKDCPNCVGGKIECPRCHGTGWE